MVKGVMSKLAACVIMVCFLAVGSSFAQTWVSPAQGSQLSVLPTVTWSKIAGQDYSWIYVGSTQGGYNYFSQYEDNNTTSQIIPGLPADNNTVYVTIWSYSGGQWYFAERSFIGRGTAVAYDGAVMTSPATNGATISPVFTFTWSDVGATNYWIKAGSAYGLSDYANLCTQSGTSIKLSNLPENGPVFIRLYTQFGSPYGLTSVTDYSYNTSSASMLTPANGSRLTKKPTFTWTNDGSDLYWLYFGSTQGAYNYYSVNQGATYSATVVGLPSDNSTVYVRLWTLKGSAWAFKDYSYIANGTFTTDLNQITTPATNGATLDNATGSTTFVWDNATVVDLNWLYIGTSQGAADILNENMLTAKTKTVTLASLGSSGSTIWVRLWSRITGIQNYLDYSYLIP